MGSGLVSGFGWQSFDPTAVVPLANPSPGATALHDVGAALRRIPFVPVASVLVGVGLSAAVLRWRRSAHSPGRSGLPATRSGRVRRAGRTPPSPRHPGRIRHHPWMTSRQVIPVRGCSWPCPWKRVSMDAASRHSTPAVDW